MKPEEANIAIIGLGYVGLPLVTSFGQLYPTLGYDIRTDRVKELRSGKDSTLEVTAEELKAASNASFSSNPESLADCNVYIVTVPTPVDSHNRPDLEPLERASQLIGPYLNKGDVVIYESTVFPGATEEICVPILEMASGLTFNADFFAGYSPERINPGDKKHSLANVVKVTAGSTPEVADFVDELYQKVVTVGTHKASSIKVAEAAKVIENTQRDLNIALINELSIIFNKLDIDTEEVLKAAGTKWNFLNFRPGLVGGHCISVDPYYLTHKAQDVGYHPEVILSGRRINDNMGVYIANRVVQHMTQQRIHVVDSKILILGLSFKENCPDLRNTRVVDIRNTLVGLNAQVDVYDPWVSSEAAQEEFGFELLSELNNNEYNAVILAVAHNEFQELGAEKIKALAKSKSILFDVKYLFPIEEGFYRL